MTLERLYGAESPFFDIAFALYEGSFPVYERRDSAEQARALKNSNYHFDIIKEDGDMLGIMFYWELDDLIFLAFIPSIISSLNPSFLKSSYVILVSSIIS